MRTVVRLSAVLIGGPRYWLLPLLPLTWLGLQAVLLLFTGRPGFEPAAAQNTLIGAPVAILAVFLGGRIITGELDERTLEVAYTVPGGAHRVWWGKLTAAGLILLGSLIPMTVLAFAFFTAFPVVQTLHGAGQGASFYLAAAMGFSTLFRSEVSGALVTIALFGLNGSVTGFGGHLRISPFWNPLAVKGADAEQLLAMTIQNRIGIALTIAAIVALTFARAERREKMLSR